MGFKNMVFNGYAKEFKIGSKKLENVFVELDLRNKEFNIYFPSNEKPIYENSSKFKEIIKSTIYIKDIIIYFPNFVLYAEKIEDIFISKYQAAGFHIGETFLSTSFGLVNHKGDNLYGFDKISITPKNGYFEFEIKDTNLRSIKEFSYKEILFKNFYIDIPPPIEFSELYSKYKLVPKKPSHDLISIEISKEINFSIQELKVPLRLAFSYIQGQEIEDFLELENNLLKIFLSKEQENKNTFPLISYKWIENFVLNFLEYWFSLKEKEREKLEMIILNLVYGKTKRMIIDSQLSHLMLVLEMISEGKVEKNKLKEILQIPMYDIAFLVEIRNKILHGYTLEKAIDIAFEKAKKEKDKEKSTFLAIKNIVSSNKYEKIYKIYLGILKILDTHVLNLIGYKGKYFNPLNEFSEEYVNEILLEDKEVLNELKNR